ncbi:MAG: membrane protein insertase YidC [Pseudomonadota bacterium]|nr:membrane protein insertase YidC [Pseudomonadota bacterium]
MRDPNERRALIAIVLCLAVFYVWSAFIAPKPLPPPEEGVATSGAPAEAPVEGALPPGAPNAVATVEPTGPCTDERVDLDTKTAHLGLSTCGGAVKTLQMPEFEEAVTVTPWWIWIWKTVSGQSPGSWRPYGESSGVLSLLSADGALATAGRGPFAADGAYTIVGRNPVTLQRVTADGLTITKTFAPTEDPAVFQVSVRFSSSVPLNGPFWVGVSDAFRTPESVYDMAPHASAVVDGSLERMSEPDEVTAPTALEGPVSWFGVENRYFLAALAPADPTWGTLSWTPVGEGHGAYLVGPSASLTPDQPIDLQFTLYTGPKHVERLAELGHEFDEAADLGFFGFFSKILLFFLGIFHSGLKNWGLSIIALTFLVRLSFYPLSAKAYKSGKAMQQVQPLLKELQEKYKDDKEAQTRETMALFQRHNVNPLGGCLPMLLQMPVFFALYSALLHTPDLFGASFLHVHDLSAPDPIGAFPFFMAVGMVLQQRMTPMTGMDPAQQQMMRFMPLIFALFMFGLPAGLSLYYALNTVLSILQQWYNTRSYKPPAAPAPA